MMMSGKVSLVDRSDGDHRSRHERSSVIVNQSKRFSLPHCLCLPPSCELRGGGLFTYPLFVLNQLVNWWWHLKASKSQVLCVAADLPIRNDDYVPLIDKTLSYNFRTPTHFPLSSLASCRHSPKALLSLKTREGHCFADKWSWGLLVRNRYSIDWIVTLKIELRPWNRNRKGE